MTAIGRLWLEWVEDHRPLVPIWEVRV